jgi:hypothetical protein
MFQCRRGRYTVGGDADTIGGDLDTLVEFPGGHHRRGPDGRHDDRQPVAQIGQGPASCGDRLTPSPASKPKAPRSPILLKDCWAKAVLDYIESNGNTGDISIPDENGFLSMRLAPAPFGPPG